MKLKIKTDGSSDLNQQLSAHSWIIIDREDGAIIDKGSKKSDKGLTNNQEEYNGIISGLEQVINIFPNLTEEDEILINTDSELIVKQLTGIYKVKSRKLFPLYKKLKALVKSIKAKINITHINREFNKDADALARNKLSEAKKENKC